MSRPKKIRPVERMPDVPQVDERLCTGCGLCVRLCPTDCLAMAGPLPWLPRPNHCISCTLCVEVCPPQALRMIAK